MLKKLTFKRISLTVLLLLLSIILYHYPEEINKNVNEVISPKIPIYLIDEHNFVSMSTINDTSKDTIERIKLIIESLTIDSNKNIDNNFKPIIPANTKLNNLDLKDGLLKLDFSKEFLNISENNEEKMLEAIIYSLTEIKEINKIMVFVNGNRLIELPHSKKRLDLYLDRSYGINKIININDIKNTQMTTIYFLAKNEDYYYVPVSFVNNNDENKINIIIKNLKSNTLNNSNLLSQLNYQVELMNYELDKDTVTLNFNNLLLESLSDGKIKEEVKYAIAYSIRDSLNIENINFMIDSETIDEISFK